jgi:cytochrome c oxidase subunit 2
VNPAGPQAAHLGRLWWFFFAVCALVFVLVMAFLLYAVARPAQHEESPEAQEARKRKMTRGVATAVGATVVILLALLAVSVGTSRRLSSERPQNALLIRITGKQWWWQVVYPQAQNLTTANEIHIPVGRQVLVTLTSYDVIHSFWVPNLNGKIDLIPGYITTTVIQADRPGVYRGQCAEFCGYQHAHMGLVVFADPPEQFEKWLWQQRHRAAEPATPEQHRGREVFLSSTCVMCHTVRGTEAAGTTGPDLTLVGSRTTIAAATLPNNRGNLAGWVLDPQSIKPGNLMPPNELRPDQLHDLIAYLESLK